MNHKEDKEVGSSMDTEVPNMHHKEDSNIDKTSHGMRDEIIIWKMKDMKDLLSKIMNKILPFLWI